MEYIESKMQDLFEVMAGDNLEPVIKYPYNSEHFATCAKCGAEMIYNVPRLGPDGGYVHRETASFDCDGRNEMADLLKIYEVE